MSDHAEELAPEEDLLVSQLAEHFVDLAPSADDGGADPGTDGCTDGSLGADFIVNRFAHVFLF